MHSEERKVSVHNEILSLLFTLNAKTSPNYVKIKTDIHISRKTIKQTCTKQTYTLMQIIKYSYVAGVEIDYEYRHIDTDVHLYV